MTLPFAYRAVDPTGRRLRGTEPAASPAALSRALESRGLLVLEVTEATHVSSPNTTFRFGQKRQVLEVTRALATLLPAGLPLAKALTAASHLATGEVRAAAEAVKSQVERGRSLADALSEHPALFPPLYIGLVRAGERSGTLDGAFVRLAAQLERDEQLRARLLSVSIYPILLALAGGVAILILLFVVVPRFAELLRDTGMTLPRSTTLLLAFSGAMQAWWPAVGAGVVTLMLLILWCYRTDGGRRNLAAVLLHLPLIGSLRRHAAGARFARLVSTLLGGGAPLLAALDDTIESVGDPTARDESARIRDRIREGAALHQTLAESSLFPPLLAQLVAVGEESGRLAQFLSKAADILEERTERALQRLVAAAEPAMIVAFGGIVGFVALSLLQAIYSMNAGVVR